MGNQEVELLKEISKSLNEINSRQATKELFADSDELFKRSDARVEYATQQIQNTLDRIHDKVFNFNNILIGAFLVLGTYPSNEPKVELWTIIFPILTMAFMIYLDIRQMGIHRFASNEQEWKGNEAEQYGKKINQQTWLSLLSLVMSIACLFYLVGKVLE